MLSYISALFKIFFKNLKCFLIKKERKEGRDKRRDTDLLFHLFINVLVIPVCALTGDQTHNRGVTVRCSNQLSPVRA